MGGPAVVRRFVIDAVRLHGGAASEGGDDVHDVDVRHVPEALREAVGMEAVKARFELPVRDGEVYLSRTHPFTEALASYVLDTALDPLADGQATRAGAMRTRAVGVRTTLISPGMVETPGFSHDLEATLTSEDIARAVVYVVSQPPHVAVNEVLVRPTDQER